MYNEKQINELMDWIDSHNLAIELLDGLQEAGEEPTVKNAKRLWLYVLEHKLPDAITSSVSTKYGPLKF